MKIKIRPHDAHMPEEEDWLPTDDWLAALRDDGRAEPASHGHAQPASGSDPRPEVRAEVVARAEAGARTEAAAPAQAGARAEITGRAVIGDQLRMPVMWCEMGSCISWYAHPAALGEADTRARAISAGWRIDALSRLACPRCQQADPGFRATRPVVPWDRYTAIARAARITARPGDGTAGHPAPGNGRDLRHPAAGPPEPGWHRQYPAAQTTPAVGAPNTPPARPFPPRGLERGPGRARLRRPPDAPGKPTSIRD